MSNSNLTIVLELVPFLSGIPSYRPPVVMHRGEEHFQDLLKFLSETAREHEARGDDAITKCHVELVENKIELIEAAIFELEHRTSALYRSPFENRLQKLQEGLDECRSRFGV
jgi:hypothetical protein